MDTSGIVLSRPDEGGEEKEEGRDELTREEMRDGRREGIGERREGRL